MSLGQTPSQTVGPFFAYGLTPEQYGYQYRSAFHQKVAADDTPGQHIRIEGRVYDGEGNPIDDALIEIWQADAEGRYPHPADRRGVNAPFGGFGRAGTGSDPEKRFVFHTIKPGAPGDGQAPHINVIVLMRGLLCHAYTRIYFADEAEANARDPVLNSVPKERRGTLLAEPIETPSGTAYRFDIHMQGERETVFFDV